MEPDHPRALPSGGGLTRGQWIDAFVTHLSHLGLEAEPQQVAALAETMYDSWSKLDSEDVAQAEWDEWPPLDGES